MPPEIRNRVTELLGVQYPIVQAPMGWIARSQLASAVSNAGGLGIIETSSGELDTVKDEIRRSAAESPVHDNWKNAIVGAAETDTVFLNRFAKPGLRALRTERGSRLERDEVVNMLEFGTAKDLYFGGDMEASLALGGQVMGRIDSVRPVADIIDGTVEEFFEIVASLGDRYLGQRVR